MSSNVDYMLGRIEGKIDGFTHRVNTIEEHNERQDLRLDKHEERISNLENHNENKQVISTWISKISMRTKAIIGVLIVLGGFAIDQAYKMTSPNDKEIIQKVKNQ